MKKLLISLVVFFFLGHSLLLNAQNEAYNNARISLEKYTEVELSIPNRGVDIKSFTAMVSIENVSKDSIHFYVNEKQFDAFLQLGLPFSTIKRETLVEQPKAKTTSDYLLSNFNTYPTYEQYDTILQTFASSYPTLCEYVKLGSLPSGREILAVHISDNVGTKEQEPRFFYTSTMHGDETAGYIFMLKLADYLLSGYGTDSNATRLVNSLDIWINPLANPDGCYYGGNSTVSGAIRNNGNGVNLNRNYPDPDDGPHPDGNAYQPETNIFMAFADTMHFTMSANFHSGSEVVNYPWDTWSKLPPDVNWWKMVSFEYADTARFMNGYNGYLNDFGTGVTNGYQWYTIAGGRQDYMNYFKQCREVTIELSNTKLLQENKLNTYWGWNKRSLLNYMKQCTYGLRGIITDSITGQPLSAKVFIAGHDVDSSHVFSYLPWGDYYRLLDSGYYNVTYSSPGYFSKTIPSVRIDRYNTTIQNIQLVQKPDFINWKNQINQPLTFFPNPAQDRINIVYQKPGMEAYIKIYSSMGTLVQEQRIKGSGSIYSVDVKSLDDGVYYFTFAISCTQHINGGKFIIRK